MTTAAKTTNRPLWLSIEEKLLRLDAKGLAGERKEQEIRKIAAELDGDGYNVSRHGGNMLQLRSAMDDMLNAGRPLMKDFNDAVAGFSLEDLGNPYEATTRFLDKLGKTWGKLWLTDRREIVMEKIEKRRLDLLIKKARELSGDEGIRFLIGENVAAGVITAELEITDEKLAEVEALIAREKAERDKVFELLEAVSEKSDEEKVRHLFDNDVSEKLILEIAKISQDAIDSAKKAMEEELAEKQRLAEEEAARKKAEKEGPSLDAIPADEMLEHIESIREIMEFSDVEREIRVMCEQSAIPKALVDIAVSDPDKLDELEKAAEG